MKNVTLVLTQEEAEELSTVLNSQLGKLQYRATKAGQPTHLDTSWAFWNGITSNLAHAMGRSWMVPSEKAYDLLS